ncbi:MAG: adenylate/guanylate cyclase protein, partial [Thermomicrobiales bacterium]|nr:adenylate/guanylate cyclase protein [Thermomicrobiales bacterium]
MPEYPRGTVAFLFTDVEGSTALWERDRAAMATAVERHLTLLRDAIEAHGGVLFKVVGDAVQAAFPSASHAVAATLDAQRVLMREAWPESVGPLCVRMALHTAAADLRNGDYLGPELNRLSRLLAAARGGQVLLSLATQNLARDVLPAGVALHDLGEHPLRDLHHPQQVFQLLHPDLPADFPPIRSLAARANNLPVAPTPFLGREDQVAGVVVLLRRDAVRLLTITGPGGVGKTRLAVQAAADVLEDFPDGVWFVDLSVLDDPILVPPAIAGALGVREAGSELTQRLARMLGERRLLLILDNFERVLEAAPFVTGLLAVAPGTKVLVTRRTQLHTAGEQEYPLSPLLLPDPTERPPLERLFQVEAVRLFAERAQAVKPDFTLTPANAFAVAEICRRLDGLPLAIELAAAFIKLLPPQALLKRLEQRLPLLTRGARDLPARQQTMRDAIAWSHDLLTQEEQTLFQRLAVFPGGCTVDAAEAVAGPDAPLDVFEGLAALIDKSLLRQEETEGEPRFRMLETVREFALERLEGSGTGEETRRRLAAWCLALGEAAQPEVIGGSMDPDWVTRLDDELPNLRAAINWLGERGEGRTALRLLAATEDYWSRRRPNTTELDRWLTGALAAAPEAPPADRTVALYLLALADSLLGHEEVAAMHAERMLQAAQESGESAARGLAQYGVGMVWEFRGHGDRAAAAFTEAVPLLRAAGNDVLAAWAQADLGDILVWRGDVEVGVPMLDEALARLRQSKADWLVLMALNQRGHAAV